MCSLSGPFGPINLVTVFPRLANLGVSVKDTGEVKGLTYVTDCLLRDLSHLLSDLRGTASDLEFVVDPSHVSEVTNVPIFVIPTVNQTSLKGQSFSLHDPRLADDRTGRLKQEVESTVR